MVSEGEFNLFRPTTPPSLQPLPASSNDVSAMQQLKLFLEAGDADPIKILEMLIAKFFPKNATQLPDETTFLGGATEHNVYEFYGLVKQMVRAAASAGENGYLGEIFDIVYEVAELEESELFRRLTNFSRWESEIATKRDQKKTLSIINSSDGRIAEWRKIWDRVMLNVVQLAPALLTSSHLRNKDWPAPGLFLWVCGTHKHPILKEHSRESVAAFLYLALLLPGSSMQQLQNFVEILAAPFKGTANVARGKDCSPGPDILFRALDDFAKGLGFGL